ncbi:MAG: family 16 glycosylhydrolase [Flavobacteriaceae bacterium]|nr:family 16 glycosylhydrolase [Flavobacteriaceae bacterium]
MNKYFLHLLVFFICLNSLVYAQSVALVNEDGFQLQVDGKDFFINGMNWDYYPIGTNYEYNFWNQPEETIKAALDSEMTLLKEMGVNAIRVYTGIPPKWITHIYKNYGIYTMVNHSFGRYGLSLNGVWKADTHYDDKTTQALLLKEVEEMSRYYKNTPGLLMYLIGNENNYGLFWQGAETEDFPSEEARLKEVGESRARPMYKLMNEASKLIKSIDGSVPVAICNGDLLFLEIIAETCPDVDIFGTNIYRGLSFGDAFDKVKEVYGKPLMFTEFGSDAFDAVKNEENQLAQAEYLVENWKEIYLNAAGLGKAENALGGFTFQFSDGWWKYGQTYGLDKHDTNASWANGGYAFDFQKGHNNMNEEWFGICAKGPKDEKGLYDLYPRAAYYALKETHQINPYSDTITQKDIVNFFEGLSVSTFVNLANEQDQLRFGNKPLETTDHNGHAPSASKKPVWQDEFEGIQIDTTRWVFDLGRGNNGWGNAELQYYTNRPANVKVADGRLIITATKEVFEGAYFTAARIKTKGKFEKKFGWFEARMKLPKGQGMWPAFWMLGSDIDQIGWPKTGEIDIMEYRGQNPNIVLSTLHGPGYSGNKGVSKSFETQQGGFDEDFHVFAVDWRADYIHFYIDGQIYHKITPADLPGNWVFDKPFFMLINLAVGGHFVGSPNTETPFPQTLEVDYVRVYD